MFGGGTQGFTGPGNKRGDELSSCSEAGSKISHRQADLSFPALAAYPGPGSAAHNCCFGGSDIIAVQAGDGEGLQNVELDNQVLIRVVTHILFLLSIEGTWFLQGHDLEEAEAKSLGPADAMLKAVHKGLSVSHCEFAYEGG